MSSGFASGTARAQTVSAGVGAAPPLDPDLLHAGVVLRPVLFL